MLLCFPHIIHYIGQLHRLVHIAGRHQKTSDIDLAFRISDCFQKMVQIQDSDYIITAVLIHGKSGVAGVFDRAEYLAVFVIDIYRKKVHSGSHCLRGRDLGKVQSRSHQF